MKKILTLFIALTSLFGANAKTVEWTVDDLGWTTKENNASLDGETLKINGNLSLTFSKGEGTNDVIYRLTTKDLASYIAFYSKNVMTVNAENAIINSITFVVDEDKDNALTTQPSPDWSVKVDGTTYNFDSPTWTGNAKSVEVVGNTKTILLGLTIEYTSTANPADFKEANLFFTEDHLAPAGSDKAKDVKVENNGASVHFITNGSNAQLDAVTSYFGTPDDYEALDYRYRPGGNSSNGIKSNAKAEFAFPCDGTLYIYAYNNQTSNNNAAGGRILQLIQDDETIFDYNFKPDDAKQTDDSKNVYPIHSTEVEAGTAYLLWIDGQLMMYGFRFVPAGVEPEPEPEVEALYLHFTDEKGNFQSTYEHSFQKKDDGFSVILELFDEEGDRYFVLSDDCPQSGEAMTIALTTDWSGYGNLYHADASDNNKVVKYDGNSEITPFSLEGGKAYTLTVNLNADDNSISALENGTTGVEDVVNAPADNRVFNLFGIPVDDSYRGIVIQNGKKFIRR